MKQKNKTKLIAALLVLALVAVGVGIYTFFQGNKNNIENGGGNGGSVLSANSIQFNVTFSEGEVVQQAYIFSAKNIGASNMLMRVEGLFAGENATYIVNGAQQEAWGYFLGQWSNLTETFPTQWSTWSGILQNYREKLAGWSGSGDFTYTASGGQLVRLYDIVVNPVLADSLFVHQISQNETDALTPELTN